MNTNWGRDPASLTLAAFLCLFLHGGLGARAGPGESLRGFAPAQVEEQIAWEEKLRAIPRPALLREYMAKMAAEPHHLGSPGSKAVAEWILSKLRSWGLNASIEEYRVLFPTPKERLLELLAPEKHTAQLKEPVIVQDPDSSDANQLPTYNAYSIDGDVTAQLVYVNYGLPGDYETLKKMGVDVKGKIVLARYGASWRGIKPKVAHENGAAACLIYSDPKDDGFYQGDVYPEGPFRPEHGVQRGSVADIPVHPGDPLTPGIGATADARRLPIDKAETLTKIPVMPISWGDALPLLKNLRGPVAPESWRGAVPVTYHVGPGPALVHFKISANWDLHTAYNVVARIEGSASPDEWIIQGNHHDAWVNGASDPVSGMIALMEEARALGEMLKQGWRPKRTILLAAWDGEEEGLLGSTEWAEHHAPELKEKAVLYINGDSNGKGGLGVSGSHSLERFIHEVARDIQDPQTGKPVYEALREYRLEQAKEEKDRRELRERPDLRIEALGSGSDYTAFVDYLGVAALNLGFGGESSGGVYHSIYDTFTWYTRFSDTTFVYGRALAQLDGTAVVRLASATVLPFEFTNVAETVGRYVEELATLARKEGSVDVDPLKSAQETLAKSAQAYEEALTRASNSGTVFRKDAADLRALNKLLYQSERMLTAPDGLPRRPWFKHQLYAPGLYTGYAVKTMPYVREALEQRRWEEAKKGVQVVRERLLALAADLDAAAKLLR